MNYLFIVRGCPGSGKSTLAKSLKVDKHIEADMFYYDDGNYKFDITKIKDAHAWCQKSVEEFMQQKLDIAVSNTFTQEWEMKPYFDMAEKYGYFVHSIIVENRHGNKDIHNVPAETISKMANRFDIKLIRDNYQDFVKIKKYDNGLEIHKYKRSVFYDNTWDANEKLVEARGTVYDANGNIVQLPFKKIFNYKENGATLKPNESCLMVEKINGFMAAVTWYNGDILVSTTGSLDSDFVKMAKEKLPLDKMKKDLELLSDYTFLFEIVHENDPHIIKEIPGAYLIGIRKKELGSRNLCFTIEEMVDLANKWRVFHPEYDFTTFQDVLDRVKKVKHEGYVIYSTERDYSLKIKSPYYLVSKFLARTKKMNMIFSKNYKQTFDEEFYPLVEMLHENFTKESYLNLTEQERLNIIETYFNQ